MKTENLNPPDEPRTKVCPNCYGVAVSKGTWEDFYYQCEYCNGTGEIIIEDNNETDNDNE